MADPNDQDVVDVSKVFESTVYWLPVMPVPRYAASFHGVFGLLSLYCVHWQDPNPGPGGNCRCFSFAPARTSEKLLA